MESVMWAFKSLWDKGLVYEGFRVVPYSWAAQTPLSNFETRLDNSYGRARTRADGEIPARANQGRPGRDQTSGLDHHAVDASLQHGTGGRSGRGLRGHGTGRHRLVLADEARERYAAELEGYTLTGTVAGSDLIGRGYAPLMPFFADRKQSGGFRVVSGDFIEMGEGTGVVHMAPAFGEDDLEVGQKVGLPIVDPVDLEGNFTDLVPPYAGKNVFDANKDIIRDLKADGSVFRHEPTSTTIPIAGAPISR